MAKPRVSLQMWTVRSLAATDFLGTFDQVAKVGYPAVELAGTGPGNPADLKKYLDNLGLAVSSMHTPLVTLEADFNKVVDTALALNCRTLIAPNIPTERRKTLADWYAVAPIFNDFGRRLRELGFTFSYHNHDWEFRPVEGQRPIDVMLGQTDPTNVGLELDVYWVAKAGLDPADFIKTHADRIPMLHLKDMTPEPDKKFAPLGAGVIDFKPIFAAAEAAHVAWYVVEQDFTYDESPLVAIAKSLHSLKQWGYLP